MTEPLFTPAPTSGFTPGLPHAPQAITPDRRPPARLVVQAHTLDDLCTEVQSVTGCRVTASEQRGRTVFVALTQRDRATAAVLRLTPLPHPLPDGANLVITIDTEENDPADHRASRTFTRHLTPAPTLPWRVRAADWQARVKHAATGEVLLGEYPEADGGVSYNPEAKRAFEHDARRYLRRLLKTLEGAGWTGAVRYNPSGVACSGDALLAGTLPGHTRVHVHLDATGSFSPAHLSPSGVGLYWRFESDHTRIEAPFQNRFAPWTATSADLARLIDRTARVLFP